MNPGKTHPLSICRPSLAGEVEVEVEVEPHAAILPSAIVTALIHGDFSSPVQIPAAVMCPIGIGRKVQMDARLALDEIARTRHDAPYDRVMKSLSTLILASVWIVGCAESGPAPRPPTPVKSSSSARAPQDDSLARSAAATTPHKSTDASAASDAAAPSSSPLTTPRADAAAQTMSTAQSDANQIEVAGLVMPKPVTWQWQAPTVQFRALQYSVPTKAAGSSDAELILSVFASGDGGPLDMNVKRWISQFRNEDGSEATAIIVDRTINDIPVKLIELRGSYQGMGQAAPRGGMLQLSAIVQAPGRTVFIRLIGQSQTVESWRAEFDALVNGIRVDG